MSIFENVLLQFFSPHLGYQPPIVQRQEAIHPSGTGSKILRQEFNASRTDCHFSGHAYLVDVFPRMGHI